MHTIGLLILIALSQVPVPGYGSPPHHPPPNPPVGPKGEQTPGPGQGSGDTRVEPGSPPSPPPRPPGGPGGEHTPTPEEPQALGSGGLDNSGEEGTKPKPGPPPPPLPGPPGGPGEEHTPTPEEPQAPGSGDLDNSGTKPKPGPPSPPPPRPPGRPGGEHTPVPEEPPVQGSGGSGVGEGAKPKPGPPPPPQPGPPGGPEGEHMPGPGGDGDKTSSSGDGTDHEPEPDRPNHNEMMIETSVNQNYSVHMYGGDIALTPEQQATLEATSNQRSPFSIHNAVVKSVQYLWKNGTLFYTFDDSLGNVSINAIKDAMNAYREQTCITFQERTTQEDYVRFFSGNGCYSYIGRITGLQDISIGRGCEHKGIVMHEIFHALGRWHEQSRPDRDLFIRINKENITSGAESNFDVVSMAFATTLGIEYDFTSLMHYDAYAFTRNGRRTIEPLDSNISVNSLGQREGLSNRDLQHINTFYCGDYAGGSWSEWSSWSSCSRTCNGGSRYRRRTCEGGADCDGSNIDKEQCNTETCTIEATWADWTSWSECTASCGGGRRSRKRNCDGGNICVGRQMEYSDCNSESCFQGSSWSEWGSWSDCSQTCQGGTRYQRRQCLNGNDCKGSNVIVQFCNSKTPCDGIVTSSEWTEWSECTEPCGGGTQFRTRDCTEESNNIICESENQPCNNEGCNPEPKLMGIEHMGCYWVPVYNSNLTFLEGATEDLTDNPRERLCSIGIMEHWMCEEVGYNNERSSIHQFQFSRLGNGHPYYVCMTLYM